MIKKVNIGDKEVEFKTSAALPRLYRQLMNRDLFVDMASLSAKMKSGLEYEDLIEIQGLVENIAYIMAKHADATIPDTIDEWLEEFETLDLYGLIPEIIIMWAEEQHTTSTPKKVQGQ